MKLFGKMFLPVIFIFIIVSLLVAFSDPVWIKYAVNKYVILGANLILFVISALVFLMQKSALSNPNPNVFIRSIVGGMMIKMFTTVLAVLAYVVLTGPAYDKKAVFISLFIYLLYLAAEVVAITKENGKKNA